MTSLHLFLLILLMRVAHFSYIVTSIITYATFKESILSFFFVTTLSSFVHLLLDDLNKYSYFDVD